VRGRDPRDDLRRNLERMAREMALARERFWEHGCPSFDDEACVDGQVRRAVVSALSIRGEVHGLVQKAW